MKLIPLKAVIEVALVAKVDDELYARLAGIVWTAELDRRSFRWRAQAAIREGRYGPFRTVMMHRLIADAPRGYPVIHLDGDTLNNQRSNLRVCTRGQVLMRLKTRPHSSRFRGVSFDIYAGRWRAQIKISGRMRCIGFFWKEEDAAKAFDEAARVAHGELATLNFPATLRRGSFLEMAQVPGGGGPETPNPTCGTTPDQV